MFFTLLSLSVSYLYGMRKILFGLIFFVLALSLYGCLSPSNQRKLDIDFENHWLFTLVTADSMRSDTFFFEKHVSSPGNPNTYEAYFKSCDLKNDSVRKYFTLKLSEEQEKKMKDLATEVLKTYHFEKQDYGTTWDVTQMTIGTRTLHVTVSYLNSGFAWDNAAMKDLMRLTHEVRNNNSGTQPFPPPPPPPFPSQPVR